ncbi:hypothetical protein AB4Z22_39905, partial [Paenibacillus sp. TAF58]
MYNNNNSFGNASQSYQSSQGFQGNNAQYQGFQRQYQPIGAVQSFYNQSNAGQANQGLSQGFNQGFNQGISQVAQATSQESFHTANYRGNQPGHDAYKRSDSSTPAQQQQSGFQGGFSSYTPVNNQFAPNQSQQFGYASAQQPFVSSQFVSSIQSNQPFGQSNVSPNAFHMANYRGNQPGHDAYKRSDSSSPSQQSFQTGFGSQQSMQQ